MTVLTRRSKIESTAALAATSTFQAGKGFGELSGSDIELSIDERSFMTGGRMGHAFAVNGTVRGPLIRLRARF